MDSSLRTGAIRYIWKAEKRKETLMINFNVPPFTGKEMDYIRQAVENQKICGDGEFTKKCSEWIEERTGTAKCLLTTSCTHATELAALLTGVGPGDEVIMPSYTFVSTADAFVLRGATPVFVDIRPDTMNLDEKLIEDAITEKTRGIVPVHYAGVGCEMDEIMDIAGRYGIPVLEDAAEALGSELNGRKCGTFGELAALSFNGNKMITTSGGGALICRTEEEARQTKFYATQARDAAPHYQHTHIGYNYRMSNICAGIGRGQMFVLDEHIARRRAIHSLYVDLLKDVAGITVMENPDSRFASNFWLTCILVDPKLAGKSREDIRLRLDSENIETRPLWKPMHLQPVFTDAPFYGNGTSERLFDIGLCLPSGPTLTDEDIRRVVDTIRAI